MRDRLAADFASPPTIALLARDAGVHPVYLCQAFRASFGISAREYIRDRQLEFARYSLLSSDKSLSQIAANAGFCDQSHFTRRFLARVGMTPARFRSDCGIRLPG